MEREEATQRRAQEPGAPEKKAEASSDRKRSQDPEGQNSLERESPEALPRAPLVQPCVPARERRSHRSQEEHQTDNIRDSQVKCCWIWLYALALLPPATAALEGALVATSLLSPPPSQGS